MKTFEYTIKDAQGIHARPAGELIKLAKGFTSTIKLEKVGLEGKAADLKKGVFGLMGLAVKQDNSVVITIDGDDEAAAYDAIKNFFETTL